MVKYKQGNNEKNPIKYVLSKIKKEDSMKEKLKRKSDTE